MILDSTHRSGKDVVLNRFEHPCRVMMLPEMMQPCRIVHSFPQLHEENQVVGAKIELPRGARKVEASVQGQFPLGILSPMPLSLYGAGSHVHTEWLFIDTAIPDKGAIGLEMGDIQCRGRLLDRGAVRRKEL